MKIIKNKIIFFLTALGLLAPLKIFALQINWPASPAGTALSDQSTLTELTKYSYEWAITLGILAFFVSIVINGVRYMTSTGDPSKTSASRKKIQSSAAGLALLLGSWVLLSFLNPRLTTLFIPDPNQPVASQLADYDAAILEGGDCDMVLFYDDKNYQIKNLGFKKVKDINQTNPEILGFVPRSLRVLKELSDSEKKTLQQQIDKENEAIRKKNDAFRAAGNQGPLIQERTLKDAAKDTYGEDPYPQDGSLYVNSAAGCVVQFYRLDNKLLIPAFGTTDVFVFQFYTSTPDFSLLYSEEELKTIKTARVVMKGK